MGQYQTRPTKSDTDLEARDSELDICISDSIARAHDIDEQCSKDGPVFGSPIDSMKTCDMILFTLILLLQLTIAI